MRLLLRLRHTGGTLRPHPLLDPHRTVVSYEVRKSDTVRICVDYGCLIGIHTHRRQCRNLHTAKRSCFHCGTAAAEY